MIDLIVVCVLCGCCSGLGFAFFSVTSLVCGFNPLSQWQPNSSRHHRVEVEREREKGLKILLCCDGAHHQKSPSPRDMERESKLIVGVLYRWRRRNWPVIQYLNKTYDSWKEKSSKWRCVVNQNINRFFNRKFLFFSYLYSKILSSSFFSQLNLPPTEPSF